MRACVLSRFNQVWLFATPWTVARQASLSKRFPRQEYWSGLPCPPPGNLPDPKIEPVLSAPAVLQADSLPRSHWGSPCPPQLGYSTVLHKGFYKPSPPSSLQPCNPPLHIQQMTLPTPSQKNQHKGSPLPLSFVCLSLSIPPSSVLNHHFHP